MSFYRKKCQPLEITVTATSTGTIKSDTEVKVAAQRAGRISALHVLEGDIVRKGDVIAELDTTEAVINLERARAVHARAEAVIEELKASYHALEAGGEADIAGADARFEDAGRQHERYSELYDNLGAAAQGRVDEFVADVSNFIDNQEPIV